MNFFVIVFLTFIFLTVLYLNCLRPNDGRQYRMEAFKQTYIAHRGLFNNKDVPENSMAAFSRAISGGYGIELDVQLTSDNKLVVFHDKTLERMCNDKRVLHDLSYDELCQLNLLGTKEKIPLFKKVLDLINGKVPLIVEIKSEGDYIKTSKLANEMLMAYKGVYCVESFHPLVVLWYRKHSPNVVRGQLSTDYSRDGVKKSFLTRFVLTNLLLNFITRPDFIAYNHKYKNQFSYKICRKLYNAVNVAWTIQSQEQLENARDTFQVFIFDSFIPD